MALKRKSTRNSTGPILKYCLRVSFVVQCELVFLAQPDPLGTDLIQALVSDLSKDKNSMKMLWRFLVLYQL